MTDSNWLTDFIAKVFMKMDNRINHRFLLLLFSVFQISRIHFTLFFFFITNAAFHESVKFKHEGRELIKQVL